MPVQSAPRRPQLVRGTRRSVRRVTCVTFGQRFDIEIAREGAAWAIRIPEIGAATTADRRSAVELEARKHIAAQTGIPLGYVAVAVVAETV